MEIKTKRLLIRPLKHDDASSLVEVMTEKISTWTKFIPYPYSLDDAISWIDANHKIGNPTDGYGVFLSDTGILVGCICFVEKDGDEIGYYLNEKYEKNGYMTEALIAVLKHCFNNGINLVTAGIHIDNHASQNLMKRVGAKVKCEETDFWPNKQQEVPVFLFELAREDFFQAIAA